ncbi:MAG: hypothetical protein AB7F75_02285 [Planctomycetota bacterium]
MGRMAAVWVVLLFITGCSGSSPAGMAAPARSMAALPDFEFVSELARCEEVTLGETLRLLHLSVGAGAFDPVAVRHAAAELGWVDEDQDLGEILTYGQAGRFFAGLCDLEDNLFLRLFGSSERYGLRECQRLGFLDAASPGQKVPGSVLMAAQSQADEHLRQAGDNPDSPLARFKASLKISGNNNP